MEPPGRPDKEGLNTKLLRELSSAISGHATQATFACGGAIAISDFTKLGSSDMTLSPPVKVRFNVGSVNHAASFPPTIEDLVGFEELLSACQPATFGFQGTDVLNEEYRKAGKLDPSQFSSNFHPHDRGMLDSVQQFLLPTISASNMPHSVRAELYKLNVSQPIPSIQAVKLTSV